MRPLLEIIAGAAGLVIIIGLAWLWFIYLIPWLLTWPG